MSGEHTNGELFEVDIENAKLCSQPDCRRVAHHCSNLLDALLIFKSWFLQRQHEVQTSIKQTTEPSVCDSAGFTQTSSMLPVLDTAHNAGDYQRLYPLSSVQRTTTIVPVSTAGPSNRSVAMVGSDDVLVMERDWALVRAKRAESQMGRLRSACLAMRVQLEAGLRHKVEASQLKRELDLVMDTVNNYKGILEEGNKLRDDLRSELARVRKDASVARAQLVAHQRSTKQQANVPSHDESSAPLGSSVAALMAIGSPQSDSTSASKEKYSLLQRQTAVCETLTKEVSTLRESLNSMLQKEVELTQLIESCRSIVRQGVENLCSTYSHKHPPSLHHLLSCLADLATRLQVTQPDRFMTLVKNSEEAASKEALQVKHPRSAGRKRQKISSPDSSSSRKKLRLPESNQQPVDLDEHYCQEVVEEEENQLLAQVLSDLVTLDNGISPLSLTTPGDFLSTDEESTSPKCSDTHDRKMFDPNKLSVPPHDLTGSATADSSDAFCSSVHQSVVSESKTTALETFEPSGTAPHVKNTSQSLLDRLLTRKAKKAVKKDLGINEQDSAQSETKTRGMQTRSHSSTLRSATPTSTVLLKSSPLSDIESSILLKNSGDQLPSIQRPISNSCGNRRVSKRTSQTATSVFRDTKLTVQDKTNLNESVTVDSQRLPDKLRPGTWDWEPSSLIDLLQFQYPKNVIAWFDCVTSKVHLDHADSNTEGLVIVKPTAVGDATYNVHQLCGEFLAASHPFSDQKEVLLKHLLSTCLPDSISTVCQVFVELLNKRSGHADFTLLESRFIDLIQSLQIAVNKAEDGDIATLTSDWSVRNCRRFHRGIVVSAFVHSVLALWLTAHDVEEEIQETNKFVQFYFFRLTNALLLSCPQRHFGLIALPYVLDTVSKYFVPSENSGKLLVITLQGLVAWQHVRCDASIQTKSCKKAKLSAHHDQDREVFNRLRLAGWLENTDNMGGLPERMHALRSLSLRLVDNCLKSHDSAVSASALLILLSATCFVLGDDALVDGGELQPTDEFPVNKQPHQRARRTRQVQRQQRQGLFGWLLTGRLLPWLEKLVKSASTSHNCAKLQVEINQLLILTTDILILGGQLFAVSSSKPSPAAVELRQVHLNSTDRLLTVISKITGDQSALTALSCLLRLLCISPDRAIQMLIRQAIPKFQLQTAPPVSLLWPSPDVGVSHLLHQAVNLVKSRSTSTSRSPLIQAFLTWSVMNTPD